MSKRDLPGTDSKRSLLREAQSHFFALDHVGVVRHFEGLDLATLVNKIRALLVSEGAKFEDSQEQVRETLVYTNVANLESLNSSLTLWITVTDVKGIGAVLDAKMFHPTEQSAEADERLSGLVDKLQKELAG